MARVQTTTVAYMYTYPINNPSGTGELTVAKAANLRLYKEVQ